MMGVEPVEDLRGSLAFTTLTDVLQFLSTTGRTGELWVEGGPNQRASQVYFDHGSVYHAQEGTTTGIDALVEIISWVEGTFIFSTNKACPTVTIDVSLQNALVEAARRLDERRREIAERDQKTAPQRLLSSFAESSGVLAAILTARDGSPLASANPDEAVKMDELGDGSENAHRNHRRTRRSPGLPTVRGVLRRVRPVSTPVSARRQRRARGRGARAGATRSHPTQDPAPGRRAGEGAPRVAVGTATKMQQATTSPRSSEPSIPTVGDIVEARYQP